MKKYLNSPEQVLIALKLGKVVCRENTGVHFKLVEGLICAFNEEGCLWVNAQIMWEENKFYVIETQEGI